MPGRNAVHSMCVRIAHVNEREWHVVLHDVDILLMVSILLSLSKYAVCDWVTITPSKLGGTCYEVCHEKQQQQQWLSLHS